MATPAVLRPRLYTIPLSHYCERARWALDEAGIAYDEEQHLQVFAGLAAKKFAGHRFVPVLVQPSGTCLNDSRDILNWASAQSARPLFPSSGVTHDVSALSDSLAETFGVEVRRFTYAWFLRCLPELLPYNEGAAPPWESLVLRVGRGVIVPRMRRYFRLKPGHIRRAREIVLRVMDDMAARLADGRTYLCGDVFTAADLTFAALAAPALLPPQHPVPFPPLDNIPDEEGRTFIRDMRAHQAGAFALRLYETRAPSSGVLTRPLRVRSPEASGR